MIRPHGSHRNREGRVQQLNLLEIGSFGVGREVEYFRAGLDASWQLALHQRPDATKELG